MRRSGWLVALPLAATILGGCASASKTTPTSATASAALTLWKSGAAAFGMFVPNER